MERQMLRAEHTAYEEQQDAANRQEADVQLLRY
jgi:hypothetical protein